MKQHKEGQAQRTLDEVLSRKNELEQELTAFHKELLLAKVEATADANGPLPTAKTKGALSVADEARLDDLEKRAGVAQRSWATMSARLLRVKGGLHQVLAKLLRLEHMASGHPDAPGPAGATPGGQRESARATEVGDDAGGEAEGAEVVALVQETSTVAERVAGVMGKEVMDSLLQAQSRKYLETAADGVEKRVQSEAASRATSRAASRAGSRSASRAGSRVASRAGSRAGSMVEASPVRPRTQDAGKGGHSQVHLQALQEGLEQVAEALEKEKEEREKAEVQGKEAREESPNRQQKVREERRESKSRGSS